MCLIVGLGNPGRAYQGSRHNVGFMLLDQLASEAGSRFQEVLPSALTCGVERAGQHVLLAKPQTYMNLSGHAVRKLVDHYALEPSELLIVYDDLALPLGNIRLRAGGSAGGQKGMRSIIEALGTSNVPRLRIGISPGTPAPEYTQYVLSKFTQEELDALQDVFDRASRAIDTLLKEGLQRAMSLYNARSSVQTDED